MKSCIALIFVLSLAACHAEEKQKAKAVSASSNVEEDCDEKAKQKIEIKEDTISLSNPSAGCSLDEEKPQAATVK